MIKPREDHISGTFSAHRQMINACKTVTGMSEGRDHSEDLDVDERIILKWILKK
jgi:hypothetical protein